MTATATIAENLKTRVTSSFAATGFVAGATPEQIAAGRSIPPGLMPPCVLILAGDGAIEDSTLTRRQRFQLVLIDRLKERGDARAVSAWTQFDTLQALFPQDGVEVSGTVFLPESFRVLECADNRAAACLTVAAVTPA